MANAVSGALKVAIWLVPLSVWVILLTNVGGAVDWLSFYDSATGWLEGRGLYDPSVGVLVNANWPPMALALVPMGFLPEGPGLWLWQAAQMALALDAMRRLHLARWQIVAACMWTPMLLAIGQGQMAGLVLWLVVKWWHAPTAGWLAALVIVKPFLAILWIPASIRSEWRKLGRSAVYVGLAVAASLAVGGHTVYADWLAAAGSVETATHVNLSLIGTAARWHLDWLGVPTAVALTCLTAFLLSRNATEESVLPLVLLASPLGWQYYALILLPMTKRANFVTWFGLTLVGMPQMSSMGLVGTVGLMILLIQAIQRLPVKRSYSVG